MTQPEVIAGVARIPHEAIEDFIRRAEDHLAMKEENGTESVSSRLLEDAVMNLRQLLGEQAAVTQRDESARALASALNDLEAAKARVERDAQARAQELREKLVVDLLPVLDNLDRTIVAAQHSGDAPAVIEGVQLTLNQLLGVLVRFGIERVDSKKGQLFDPRLHDAISLVPVSQPSEQNTVIDQIEPGYRYGYKMLRPAKVIVGRHTSEIADSEAVR